MTQSQAHTPPPQDPGHHLQTLFKAGEFGAALRYFQEDASPHTRTPEAVLLAATAAARVGEYDLGWNLAVSAHDRFARAANDRARSRALNLLGGIAFERGRLSEAEPAFHEAAHLAEQSGEAGVVAHAWNNLGMIAHLRDQLRPATERFQRALVAYEALGDVRGAAQTHHNLGLACRDLGGLHEADRHVEEAVRLADLSRDPPLLALTLMGRAEVAFAREDLEEAGRDLEAAADLACQAGDQFGVAEGHRLRALLALRYGELESALAHATAARNQARELSAAVLAAECAALGALALRALQRGREAEVLYLEAVTALREQGALRALRRIEKEWARAAQPPEDPEKI